MAARRMTPVTVSSESLPPLGAEEECQASRRKRASRRPGPPAPARHTAGAEKRKDAALAAAGGVRFSLCHKCIVYLYTEFIT